MTSSTIVHFAAVLGVHQSSLAYRNAYDYATDLAALLWICRLLFLEYSLPRLSYDTLVYRWPCRAEYLKHRERLEAIRTKYMLRGCYSPLAKLIELEAFGKSIVRREGARATLTWAPGGGSFTIGNHKVIQLSEFCTTRRAAITQVQELVTELMLAWDPAINLSTIHDDLTCQSPGWRFLGRPKNRLSVTHKAMARRGWSSKFRGRALATRALLSLPRGGFQGMPTGLLRIPSYVWASGSGHGDHGRPPPQYQASHQKHVYSRRAGHDHH